MKRHIKVETRSAKQLKGSFSNALISMRISSSNYVYILYVVYLACIFIFLCLHDYVYISDMARRWCTLEGGFLSYYESERSPSAISRVDVTEVVTLAVSNTETMTGAGYVHP